MPNPSKDPPGPTSYEKSQLRLYGTKSLWAAEAEKEKHALQMKREAALKAQQEKEEQERIIRMTSVENENLKRQLAYERQQNEMLERERQRLAREKKKREIIEAEERAKEEKERIRKQVEEEYRAIAEEKQRLKEDAERIRRQDDRARELERLHQLDLEKQRKFREENNRVNKNRQLYDVPKGSSASSAHEKELNAIKQQKRLAEERRKLLEEQRKLLEEQRRFADSQKVPDIQSISKSNFELSGIGEEENNDEDVDADEDEKSSEASFERSNEAEEFNSNDFRQRKPSSDVALKSANLARASTKRRSYAAFEGFSGLKNTEDSMTHHYTENDLEFRAEKKPSPSTPAGSNPSSEKKINVPSITLGNTTDPRSPSKSQEPAGSRSERKFREIRPLLREFDTDFDETKAGKSSCRSYSPSINSAQVDDIALPVNHLHKTKSKNDDDASVARSLNGFDSLSICEEPASEMLSPEGLEDLEEEALKSNNPRLLFSYAKKLIDAANCASKDGRMSPNVAKQKKAIWNKAALRIIFSLCNNKSNPFPPALYLLGMSYSTGALGLPINHHIAYQLFHDAAYLNHPPSVYKTAICYELGAGVQANYQKAFHYYLKAANVGDKAAMYKMGIIYLNGQLNQPKDFSVAMEWFKYAADNADIDNPYALHELGLLYEDPARTNGFVQRDPKKSFYYFLQAAKLMYAPSQYRLGFCYENGTLGCEIDARKSIIWFSRGAEQGHADCELGLSGWYFTGSKNLLQQNDREAYLWAKRAADKGLAKAEFAVGHFIENGIGTGQPPNLNQAIYWYKRSAAQGSQRAINKLKSLNIAPQM